MSWLRRLLLLAGLVTGAWLLGGAAEANADVKIEIDRLGIQLELPVVDIEVEVATAPVARQPDAPVPPKPEPAPRGDAPEPPPVALPVTPVIEAPVQAEVTQQHVAPPPVTTQPSDPVPAPEHQPPQPQVEQPVTGTLPQSGAGATTSGTQIPAGTLPCSMRPPTTTTSLVSTEQHDAPRTVRAEEPTFSPD